MKLSEYLPLRGIKANALTKREARDIGITLDKGWAKRHANVEVPAHLVGLNPFIFRAGVQAPE